VWLVIDHVVRDDIDADSSSTIRIQTRPLKEGWMKHWIHLVQNLYGLPLNRELLNVTNVRSGEIPVMNWVFLMLIRSTRQESYQNIGGME
jgi:hypothetical protein